MDQAERIPIALDDPPAAVGEAATDARGIVTTTEADGTLRIELPVVEACDLSVSGEITVCADKPAEPPEIDDGRFARPPRPLAIKLSDSASIAPEVGAGEGALGGSGVGARVTLQIKF